MEAYGRTEVSPCASELSMVRGGGVMSDKAHALPALHPEEKVPISHCAGSCVCYSGIRTGDLRSVNQKHYHLHQAAWRAELNAWCGS